MEPELTIRVEDAVEKVKDVVEKKVEKSLNGKSWSCGFLGWTYTCTSVKNVVPPAK